MAGLASGVFFGRDPKLCEMAIFTAYFDSSGTERDKKVVTTVGVIATGEKWDKFDRRWSEALAEFGVTQLHMKDFAHFKNEFESWRGQNALRTEFLARLIKEIKCGVNKVLIHSVMLSDYREADARFQMSEHIGGAYGLAQLSCMQRCKEWIAKRKGPATALQLFIEEGDVGQDAFRKFIRTQSGPQPIFIPKVAHDGRAYAPLQAADLIAYEHRIMHESVADIGLLPHELDRRGSLQAIRRMLPFEGSFSDLETMVTTCVSNGFPERT